MDYNCRVLPPEELMEDLLNLLNEVESVPLVISGNSMSPFLVHGRDTVFLSKIREPLKRGDMVFYRRNGGAYVLHRIYRMEKEEFTFVGDAQTQLEPGIRQNQVLAVVKAVRRKGKLLKKGSFCWMFFEKIWIRIVPLRPMAVRAYSALRTLF